MLYVNATLVFNHVRAMIRTVNPREHKHLEAEQKFKKKVRVLVEPCDYHVTKSHDQVLMDNIKRVSNLVRTILSTAEFIESTWSWKNKALSFFSLLVSRWSSLSCC